MAFSMATLNATSVAGGRRRVQEKGLEVKRLGGTKLPVAVGFVLSCLLCRRVARLCPVRNYRLQMNISLADMQNRHWGNRLVPYTYAGFIWLPFPVTVPGRAISFHSIKMQHTFVSAIFPSVTANAIANFSLNA